MSYRDALIVALILTIATATVPFMVTNGYDVLVSDSPRFVYNIVTFSIASFTTTFITLTGLTAYAKRKGET